MASQFPKMGEHPLEGNVVNMSGARSANTTPVARKGPSADVLATGGKANKGQASMDGYHPGPAFAPQTRISFPNDPAASQTGRGMRTLPPAGNPFWDARSSDNGGEVIK